MLKLTLNLQKAFAEKNISLPAKSQFKKWIIAALTYDNYDIKNKQPPPEITIRIVDTTESAALNSQYRDKPVPTNVLSFPNHAPAESVKTELHSDTLQEDATTNYLGDLVICASIVKQEAREQNKTFTAHLAHLVLHGTLHLLGYVHNNKKNAKIMETQEIKILAQLGYNNPYDEI